MELFVAQSTTIKSKNFVLKVVTYSHFTELPINTNALLWNYRLFRKIALLKINALSIEFGRQVSRLLLLMWKSFFHDKKIYFFPTINVLIFFLGNYCTIFLNFKVPTQNEQLCVKKFWCFHFVHDNQCSTWVELWI